VTTAGRVGRSFGGVGARIEVVGISVGAVLEGTKTVGEEGGRNGRRSVPVEGGEGFRSIEGVSKVGELRSKTGDRSSVLGSLSSGSVDDLLLRLEFPKVIRDLVSKLRDLGFLLGDLLETISKAGVQGFLRLGELLVAFLGDGRSLQLGVQLLSSRFGFLVLACPEDLEFLELRQT